MSSRSLTSAWRPQAAAIAAVRGHYEVYVSGLTHRSTCGIATEDVSSSAA